MSTRIGGRVDDMFATQTEMNAAGEGASAHAAEAGTRVERLQGEVADVANVMRNDFMRMGADLDAIITRTAQTLQGADWDGTSRANADAAEAQFRSDVTSALAAAMTGVDNLDAALLQQVMAFHDEVTTTFATIMHNIETNYVTLGRGAQNFANHIAEGDAVAIQFG